MTSSIRPSQEGHGHWWEGSCSSLESWLKSPFSDQGCSMSPEETSSIEHHVAETSPSSKRAVKTKAGEPRHKHASKWASQPWSKLGARSKRKSRRRGSLIGSAPPGMSWATGDKAAEDSPADTSKSDTELLDLDPLAPLDHINAVIKQLEEREAAAEEALARQRGFEAVPTLGTLEGSIFDESLGSQRYGLYGEWKDSDSCMSGQTSLSSRQLQLLDFVARGKGNDSVTGSEAGEDLQSVDIEGFLDKTGRSKGTDGIAREVAAALWSTDAALTPARVSHSQHTTLLSGASIESLRRAAAMMENSPEGRRGSEGAVDDSDLGTPVQCTPSPSPLRPFLIGHSTQSGLGNSKPRTTSPFQRPNHGPSGIGENLRRSLSPRPGSQQSLPVDHVTEGQGPKERRSSLILLPEADFLHSEHDRSSVESKTESRAGIVSLSYMMSVWDKESNEHEDRSSCAISDALSIGGAPDDFDAFAFEVDPQGMEMHPLGDPTRAQSPADSSTPPGQATLPPGALDPAKAQSGLTEKRKALSASLPERASEEPSGLGRRQGTNELIQNEPADAKQHPMGSAISRLGRKISQIWTSKPKASKDASFETSQEGDLGRSIAGPAKPKERSQPADSKDQPARVSEEHRESAYKGSKRSKERTSQEAEGDKQVLAESPESQARLRSGDKPRSYPIAYEDEQRQSLGTGSTMSRADSHERRKRRHRRRREMRALHETKPLASLRRVPVSDILRSYDASPEPRQAAQQMLARLPLRERAPANKDHAPGLQKGPQKERVSSSTLKRLTPREQSTKVYHGEGAPRPAGVPGTPEIQEIAPSLASDLSLPALAARPQGSPFTEESGRPLHKSKAVSRPRPDSPEPKGIQEAPPVQVSEAKPHSPKERSRAGGKPRRRKEQAGSRGRSLSSLLTSMPEITDIGFKSGLRFVRKLSRGNTHTALPAEAAEPLAKREDLASEKAEVPKARAASIGSAEHKPAAERLVVERPEKRREKPTLASLIASRQPADEKAAVLPGEAFRSQVLADRGPLRRSAGPETIQPLRSSDWLYATMPSSGSGKLPMGLDLMPSPANRAASRSRSRSQSPAPGPMDKVEYESSKPTRTQPTAAAVPVPGAQSGAWRERLDNQGLAQPRREPSIPEGMALVPSIAEPGMSQHKAEKPRPVQRALFKAMDSSTLGIKPVEEKQPVAPVEPASASVQQSTDNRQALLSIPTVEPSSQRTAGEAVASAEEKEHPRHPLMQHISPAKPVTNWRSHSLPPAKITQPPSRPRCTSLPEHPARLFMQGQPQEPLPEAARTTEKQAVRSLNTASEKLAETITIEEQKDSVGTQWWGSGKYEGQVGDRYAEGRGVLTKKQGGSYAGKWEHSAFQGAGVEDFPADFPIVEFLGQFHQGLRHGAGISRFSSGSVYVGEWYQGNQHGIGRLDSKKEADPRLFVGSFRNNVRHGLGVANYADGEEYAGEFHAGAAEGYGVAELGDRGGVYEGEWRDGMRHGWAVSTLNNHAMWAGQWVGGRPCWLAQLRSPLNGELADDAAEAMDICDEVARRARAVGRKAKAQAEEFGDPAGHMQEVLKQAVAEAQKEARRAREEQQRAAVKPSISKIGPSKKLGAARL